MEEVEVFSFFSSSSSGTAATTTTTTTTAAGASFYQKMNLIFILSIKSFTELGIRRKKK